MAYRDELEALRAHVDRLEQENAALRRDNDELRTGSRDAETSQSTARAWLGGPLRVEVDERIEGELPERAHERVIEILRGRFGMIGETSVLGGTLSWKIGPPAAQRRIEVTVTARDGGTQLRVSERLGDLAGGLFGGVVGGAGGGGLGGIVPLGMMVDPLLALVLAPAWVGAVYAIVRAGYGNLSRRREREVRAVAREIEAEIRASIAASARGERPLRVERVRVAPDVGETDPDDARDGAQSSRRAPVP